MQDYDYYRFVQRQRDLIASRDMTSPVRCCQCGRVYDLGTVTVTARYTDCSVWRTPCCNISVDDRGEYGIFGSGRRDYERIETH